jgi:hypothetical protein
MYKLPNRFTFYRGHELLIAEFRYDSNDYLITELNGGKTYFTVSYNRSLDYVLSHYWVIKSNLDTLDVYL